MPTLEEVFEAYRDYSRRAHDTRKHRQSPRTWSTSPLREFGDWHLHDGLRMINIPAAFRLPDVNPLLIDFNLQMIWARPVLATEKRLYLLDRLYENLFRERKFYENTFELTRLVLFHGDPRDGAPKEAAP